MVVKPSTSKLPSGSSKAQLTPKPWYRHITLDLILLILANSVFHPWITLVFYLCLASVHKHKTPLAYYTLYYTAVLAVVEMSIWLNHRLTYGKHRKVNWEDEVVVITGGAQGLGRTLAEMIMRKGGKVAVLDVLEPDESAREEMERWDLVWERVDVADEMQVKGPVERIVDELGPPTILINNAALSVTGLPMVPADNITTLSSAEATKTLTTNTLSHFTTLSIVLPYLLSSTRGAHIITISSILSHLSPSRLSDYSASKAAISSLHNTLYHELLTHSDHTIFSRVKLLLVEPGMLSTQLFSDITSVPWYANFFGPVLEAKDVAKEIVKWVERGDGGVIRMPFYAKCVPLLSVVPGSVQRVVRWWSGIDTAIVEREKRN
ncbi:hypothetical protein H2200_002616 [Cladophialophora chaetospira]|uniref:NAD(P)-binding protein n=1 Tax=Cladophialophora chaetospira TaxID=386627 RepID=A0AA38XJC0_9EURO|nr:hypothetical protein H2200_002616 [Cladophialophora chaetospira]